MSGQQHQREFELSAPTDTGCTSKETSLARDYSMVSSPSIDFNDETPRHSMELERVVSWIPPASPSGTKKTRSRAAQFLPRTDSLRESKVLMVTGMRRSESIIEPELFHYHDHFEFLSLIGETKTSEVFRVKHRQSGEIFAVKRSRKRFRSKLQRERCLREIEAVAALPSHENIVAQYRAWQEGGHFYIQMDYCDGGSLHQCLHHDKTRSASLGEEELWGVVLDVAKGLQFLHTNSVLHLDIKPENLYRKLQKDGSYGCWKIGDFGLAIGKEATDWEEGDGDYVAPELLKLGSEPSPAADIFSLGATIYECATGNKLPRRDGSPNADISNLDTNNDLQNLLQAMTLPDPLERPMASQVVDYAREMISRTLESKHRGKNSARIRSGVKKRLPSLSPIQHSELSMQRYGFRNGISADDNIQTKLRLPLLKIPKSNSTSNNTTGRTEASNSFRIQRRDINSPARDGITSTSGTTGSLSELEFSEVVSPRSQRDGTGLFGPLSSRLLRGAGTLAFDLNTSPDVALSEQSSPIRGKCHTRLLIHKDEVEEQQKSISAPTTARSSSGGKLAVWNEFADTQDLKISCTGGKSRYKSPFESQLSDRTNRRTKVPHLDIPRNTFGKKRQHSSRKLSASTRGNNTARTSSRSNDLNSYRSVENLMPQKKGARYTYQGNGHLPDNAENLAPPADTKEKQRPCPVSMAMNSMRLE